MTTCNWQLYSNCICTKAQKKIDRNKVASYNFLLRKGFLFHKKKRKAVRPVAIWLGEPESRGSTLNVMRNRYSVIAVLSLLCLQVLSEFDGHNTDAIIDERPQMNRPLV